MATCIHCGAPLPDGSPFCNSCGKKQVITYTKEFVRTQTNSSTDIINAVNQWLDENPYVANIKCQTEMKTGVSFFTNKWLLDRVVLKYEMFSKPNTYQYHFTEISKSTLFSGFGINTTDELVAAWKQENPDKTVVYNRGGTHTRGKNLWVDVGNSKKIQSFVLYKQPRGTVQSNNVMLPAAQPKKSNTALIVIPIVLAVLALLCGVFFAARAIARNFNEPSPGITSYHSEAYTAYDTTTSGSIPEMVSEAWSEMATHPTAPKEIALSGSNQYDNMTVSFTRMDQGTLVAHITNNSDRDYCFGWVSGKIVLTCESGAVYYINNASGLNSKVPSGFDEDMAFTFENYDGSDPPVSVEFRNTIRLDNHGLPESANADGSIFRVDVEVQ